MNAPRGTGIVPSQANGPTAWVQGNFISIEELNAPPGLAA
jgi:hypothetical protein